MRKEGAIVYKNIYYMLMYAVDELRKPELRPISSEDFISLNDLYASILNNSLLYMMSSGILQEYEEVSEYTDKPRGRIDIANSLIGGRYYNGLIHCTYSILDIDNDINRVIKLAINILLTHSYNIKTRRDTISPSNIRNLKLALNYFSKVTNILPFEVDFASIDLTHLGVEHKTAFYMSKFIIEEFITKENGSDKRIIEAEDSKRMYKIFEKFIRNYYIINYKSRDISVGSRQFYVDSTAKTIFNKSVTDITIENKRKNRVLIIDTKWYRKVLNQNNKISSVNQSQIKNYVRDYRDDCDNDKVFITGIILYAKPNISLDIEEIESHYLPLGKSKQYGGICTKIIDLSTDFNAIKTKLDTIFSEYIL